MRHNRNDASQRSFHVLSNWESIQLSSCSPTQTIYSQTSSSRSMPIGPMCIGYDMLPYFYTQTSVGMRTWVNHPLLRAKPGINLQMTWNMRRKLPIPTAGNGMPLVIEQKTIQIRWSRPPKIGLLRQARSCHTLFIVVLGAAGRSHRPHASAVPLCISEEWPMS